VGAATVTEDLPAIPAGCEAQVSGAAWSLTGQVPQMRLRQGFLMESDSSSPGGRILAVSDRWDRIAAQIAPRVSGRAVGGADHVE